jgi:hypothetical protein
MRHNVTNTLKEVKTLMKRFKLLTLLLMVLLIPASAFAVATDNMVIMEKVIPSFAVAGVGITPAATPTDLLTITGSATRTVHIRRITVSGLATTAGTMDVSLVRRSTADAGGTIVTQGSSMTVTPANGNYNTFTISSQNLSSVINSGSTTETATLTVSGLTVGTQYLLAFTPTISSGQVPTVTISSGATLSIPSIPTVVSATPELIPFFATATSAVFNLTNTAAANWSTASTTVYATSPTPVIATQSNAIAPMASVILYSANPSSVGTSLGQFMTKKLNFGLAGAAGTIDFSFPDTNYLAPLLIGVGQSVAVSLNGGAVPSGGTLSYTVEWEEF